MSRAVDLLEYSLTLSTGEPLLVAEADPGRIPSLSDPAVLGAVEAVLSRCTSVTREALEEAKIGGTVPLEDALGTSPRGCLLKMDRPVCGEISRCAIADRARCTTRGVRKGAPDFPMCWTFELGEGVPASAEHEARDLADRVVDAWRSGRYVLVVRG